MALRVDEILRMTCSRRAGAVLLLVLLCAAPTTVAAKEWDPAAAVMAYSAALNTHDVASALVLFDANGSAGNSYGRHFGGPAGLTEFLLGSGFADPDAHITTISLLVVANRAFWTYTCSCSDGSIDVRIVMNDQNKISVFAIMEPPAKPLSRAEPGVLPWVIGLGLVAVGLAGGLGVWRVRSAATVRRPHEGRLLAALAARGYTVGGAAWDRVELPAAAITSFSNSEDRAGP